MTRCLLSRRAVRLCVAAWLSVIGATSASAQSLGTFRWQQQPYCNVITLSVVQRGEIYQLDGYDDQCGAGTRASAAGLAFLNPNGSIGFGLAVVTTPGGTPLHLDATIELASLSGTWRDGHGLTGAWTFLPGPGPGGPPRPAPRASFPGGIFAGSAGITDVADPVHFLDAANKSYFDEQIDTVHRAAVDAVPRSVDVMALSGAVTGGALTPAARGCLTFPEASSARLRLDLLVPVGAVPTEVRLRYRDVSLSQFLSMDVRAVDFVDPGADSAVITAFTVTDPGNGRSTLSLPVLPPASETRIYYLEVDAPAHTGELSFCGAQVRYRIQ